MKYTDFTMKEHGFVGHMAEPDEGSDRAVIIIMGGEQSLLPGIKFAERFADYGITGLAVSLFGAEGLPDSPNMIPIDMFLPAVEYLRERKQISRISIYGQSMGSIFAVMVAQHIGGFENLIMVSPTHVPFVTADFSAVKTGKYYRLPDASYKVTGMWIAYNKAYSNDEAVRNAMLHPEKSEARILMIAGDEDECWPAEYSVKFIQTELERISYGKDIKAVIYPHGSHLNGLMPNREREKKLYRMIPLIKENDKKWDRIFLKAFCFSLCVGCISFIYFHIACGNLIQHFNVLYDVTGNNADAAEKALIRMFTVEAVPFVVLFILFDVVATIAWIGLVIRKVLRLSPVWIVAAPLVMVVIGTLIDMLPLPFNGINSGFESLGWMPRAHKNILRQR